MYDYMKALRQRFYKDQNDDLRCEIEQRRKELSARLDEENRKLLLRLIDAQMYMEEKISLDSFISGFRIASGIARELEPYIFDEEEELRIFEKQKGGN